VLCRYGTRIPFALLGPSGCGKTTTMRSIAGLETPSEGDIYIDERRILGIPIHKRDVGMVFQAYALFPHLSIYDNIAFGLKMRRMPPATVRGKIDQALKLTRLAELSGIEPRYPHPLSGGQRQRVALADRIAVMKDGQIEQIGTPSEIYETPRSRFVADFIGVSNFFQAEVEHVSNGGVKLRTGRGLPV
jgi:ABC-type Fe3+/spermidine/putrescine transport system ATPase subunit